MFMKKNFNTYTLYSLNFTIFFKSLLIVFSTIFLFNDNIKAQSSSGSSSVSGSTLGPVTLSNLSGTDSSDYRVTVKFNQLTGGYYECKNTMLHLYSFKDSTYNFSNLWLSFSNYHSKNDTFLGSTKFTVTNYKVDSVFNKGRDTFFNVGPSFPVNFYNMHIYHGSYRATPCADCACSQNWENKAFFTKVSTKTGRIRPPKNVHASKDTSDSHIYLKWKKGTDIPDTGNGNGSFLNLVYYKIYRNDTLIATVNGDKYWYDDSLLGSGKTYKYRVTTFTNKFGIGNHESDTGAAGSWAIGKTFSAQLEASDREFSTKTFLTWKDMSNFADDIEVNRVEGTDTLQLAVLNRSSKNYADVDGIPGYTYVYTVRPLKKGSIFRQYSDTGTRKVNGIITGKVVSRLNAGVAGVVVYAETSVDVNGKSMALKYFDTTDNAGYYEIKDVYYHKKAEFTIYPEKPKHGFKSATLKRTLDTENPKLSGVDFTDTTVFSIIGKVGYPSNGFSSKISCGVAGISILLNGKEISRTDDTGRYAFAIQDEGNITIIPNYSLHHFSPSKASFFLDKDIIGLNFLDIEKDTIFIKVIGGCDSSICDYASVRIRSTKGELCYDTTIRTDPSGNARLILAAREYEVKVDSIYPVNTNVLVQLGKQSIKLNLAIRDSVKEYVTHYVINTIPTKYIKLPSGKYDTILGYNDTISQYKDSSKISKLPKADFIYQAPIKIEVNFADVAEKLVCLDKDKDIPLLKKGSTYKLTIQVYEEKSHCPIKEGKLRIYDYVGDKGDKATILDIKDGFAYYDLRAGEPNIDTGGKVAHPNQKSFFMVAQVGFLDDKTFDQYVLVTGSKARDKTFVTRSPGIPFLILHDPPGDQSFSYIEKGSTFTRTLEIENNIGGAAGFTMDITAGLGFSSIFGEAKAGFATDLTLKAGVNGTDINSRDVSLTFNERFSTTDAEDISGYPGDVFVGAALNLLYALADVLNYDESKCSVNLTNSVVIDPVGFATTFIYTERFIEESEIPRLEQLRDLSSPDEAITYQVDIDNWDTILTNNRKYRDKAAVKLPGSKGNISISYGADYEATTEYDTTGSNTHTLETFFESEAFLGARTEAVTGAWLENKIGAVLNINYSNKNTNSSSNQNKTTIGYHIGDNDYGDYHSIDILTDTAYGVPAFRLVSGATSCPHEDSTQRRDLASLTINPPIRTEVPHDKQAIFTMNAVNRSQSADIRDYEIFVVPQSNPDGAIVKLSGQNISFTPAFMRLNPFQNTIMQLTVEKGPLANQYEDLEIKMIAPCDHEMYMTSSESIFHITAEFQNECSKVAIYSPVDGWIQNTLGGDNLNVALTGYDANDPNLSSIKLEYLREGTGWQEALTIPKGSLTDKFYDAKFNTKYVPDGNYKLRAVSQCVDKDNVINSINYSEIVKGKIDRKQLELFGTPYPSNQILNFGQDISVEFDKDIDNSITYYPGKIAIQRMDNKKYLPLTYTVSGNKMIIKPYPVSLLDSLEGILLKATVIQIKDLSGNMTVEPIEWEFVVSRSPVFWQPSSIKYSIEKGKPASFNGTLINQGSTVKNYTISKYPVWITPSKPSGNIGSSGGTENINFTISSGLNPGIYTDTIWAVSGAYKLKLYFEVEILSPQPRWVKQKIDPSQYEHSMNIIAQFSTNVTDNPLSTDTKDAIGVFVNDSLRGKGYITYDQQLRKYFALITVYSNGETNDSLSFRMWDAYPGVQYRAIESKVFRKDVLIGQINSPFILHPKGFYQTINMNKGWNWFGLFVKNNNQTPSGIFGKAVKDSMTIVKTRDNYSQYNGGSWYGNIDTLRAGIGYMIKVPKPDTVEIYGSSYGPELITPIEGNNNWSWVGNADLFGSTVKNKLINLNATTSDVIKSQTEFAVFDGTNWTGNLGYLEPGAGYKIRTTVPGEFKTQKLYKTLPGWNLNFSGMEHNMNVTAELFKGTKRIFDSHYLIGAFINGKCQGVAQPVFSDKLNRYVVYLTVLGDDAQIGSSVILKLFDTDLGAEIPQTSGSITFTPDGVNGTVSDPFDLVINAAEVDKIGKSKTSLICYPNPFDSQIHIDLNLPKKDNVEIYITDALGRKVETLQNGSLSPGNHTWLWDGNKSPQGIYFCITRINGEIIRTTIMKK